MAASTTSASTVTPLPPSRCEPFTKAKKHPETGIDRTKAGVMIHNTLDPASQHGIVLITPTGRVVFQWRDRKTGITRATTTGVNGVTFPHWVRLTRRGNQFTAQHSHNGVQWEAVVDPQEPNRPTSIEIPMNGTVHIGLAVSSHNVTRAAEARLSNVTLTGAVTPSGPFDRSQDIGLQIPPLPDQVGNE